MSRHVTALRKKLGSKSTGSALNSVLRSVIHTYFENPNELNSNFAKNKFLCKINDYLYGVIDFNVSVVRATVKYAASIETPPGCITSDGEWSDIRNMVHHGIVIIMRESLIASNVYPSLLTFSIVLAISCSPRMP